ncbi:MAG: DUF6276 family protein [Halobacteriaceae archaeon]
MDCPNCDAPTLAFPLPPTYRAHFPGDRPGAAICTRCLHVTPVDDPPADLPDFTAVSDALPANRDHALTVVCLLGLLDSIALHRDAIDALTDEAESEGTDVMLVLDRLGADESVAPHFDLEKRTHQLEQLLR